MHKPIWKFPIFFQRSLTLVTLALPNFVVTSWPVFSRSLLPVAVMVEREGFTSSLFLTFCLEERIQE